MSKTNKERAVEVETLNRQMGWYDGDRDFGMEIALLHSEVSEMLEAYRQYGLATTQREKDGKPLDVSSEAADLFIRLLDFCKRYNIDLDYEYERKMVFNRTRPYRHGDKLA